ncbi:UDP-N-acetylmuramoyl-tripeptide--D-alanyl-D-alanine ligase [Rhodobacterales bacterium HKCCE2091]|nr:UDP-N-acetylmuramoyl-tripeptide--D-alanyl-D-alanine ligase [Rhodobacterales bacterium HKCCE2091]
MTALWNASEAREATGGSLHGPDGWTATGVSIDTRTIRPGDLFIALTAARDAHDFVAEALNRGAAAALVSRVPEGCGDKPLLVVDDVQAGLEALGRAGRARSGAKVIAVTGSAGKTTTKEMLRAALSDQGETHASAASYNNHWGVPLTLARLPASARYAVIEIGMNAPGEIAPLSRMAAPHVAIVTNVAAAHLEAFGGVEDIAREKAAIFDGLAEDGTAIVNADIATAPILLDHARARGVRILRFGNAPGSEAWLDRVEVSEAATVARAELMGAPVLLKLGVPGRHLAMNAMAALAAVSAAGADPARANLALSSWRPVSGRGTRERITLNLTDDDGVELIDDAFNANPASVAASLEVLAAMQPEGRGRRIAVLGDMLELGPSAPRLHAGLATEPAMAAIDLVHTAGALTAHLDAALPQAKRGLHCDTADELARAIPSELRAGDILLVKGSKSSNMSRVVDALRKLGQAVAERG